MNEETPDRGEPVKRSDTTLTGFRDVDEAWSHRSGKRKARDGESSQRMKKKAPGFQQKNALQLLNELKTGLKYVVESQKGPSHDPQFEVFVHVNGQDFIGLGRSKQKAKLAAAQAALSLFDIPETLNLINKKNGFEEDILISSGAIAVKADPIKIINEAHTKSPIVLLNELHPSLAYNLVEDNSTNPTKTFRMSVEVNCKTYEGSGQKKKHAKAAVARAVLCDLYNECYSLYIKTLLAQSDDDDDNDDLFPLPQELADKMETMHL